MGISLTGLTPSTTYDALIKVGDNGPIDGTLKTLSDGLGNDLPMEVSTTGVNFTNQLQQGGVAVPTASQVAAKQDTLVSGTNIKTINGTSVLGSGNIAVVTSPSGVSGAIQFSNGSAFASDAANFFWDDTNNRLGVGTNAPTATTHIKGSGSTSATTSLLVQNSAGTQLFKVADNGESTFLSTTSSTPLSSNAAGSGTIAFELLSSNIRRFRIFGTSTLATLEASNTGGITTNAALNVGGSAAAQASAILQADSTTRGFLPPRMTTTEKNAIASPAAGLVVYDSTTNKLQCYNGSTWNDLF
jgi:hypothetical protein